LQRYNSKSDNHFNAFDKNQIVAATEPQVFLIPGIPGFLVLMELS